MRLVCVCPNPAIDHTVVVPSLVCGETARAVESLTTAGGKGLNVARFARGFGVHVTVVTWLGETGADLMHALARRDGLTLVAAVAPGLAVRVCPILVVDDGSVLATSDPAPVVDSTTWSEFMDLAGRAARDADAVCVSGSFPRVEGLDPVRSLLSAVGSAGALWVDTSGAALAAVADACPGAALKVNLTEAGALIGEVEPVPEAQDRERALAAAGTLGRAGRQVVVTAGRAGAAASTASGLRWEDSPAVEARNPTASGDAFMAGYLCAGHASLGRISDPLRAGVLAGAANARSTMPAASAQSVLSLASQSQPKPSSRRHAQRG